MATDGPPKTYYNQYREAQLKPLDGQHVAPRHRERQILSGGNGRIDLRQVAEKLELHIADANGRLPHKAYAEDMLHKHYNSVFTKRNKTSSAPSYKVYLFIHQNNEKETFIIRVARNNLRSIIEKMPKPGKYRFFFKNNMENSWEEVENEDSLVQTQVKDDVHQIFCHVFPDPTFST